MLLELDCFDRRTLDCLGRVQQGGDHGLHSRGVTSARLQLRMVLLVAITRVLLRRRDTTAALRLLIKWSRRWPEFSADEGLRAVRRAAKVFRANCLAQSVALTVALQGAKKSPVLILGCRRYENRSWGAHAWVLVDSAVLDALPSGAHEPLARLSADTQWIPAPIPPGDRVRESG